MPRSENATIDVVYLGERPGRVVDGLYDVDDWDADPTLSIVPSLDAYEERFGGAAPDLLVVDRPAGEVDDGFPGRLSTVAATTTVAITRGLAGRDSNGLPDSVEYVLGDDVGLDLVAVVDFETRKMGGSREIGRGPGPLKRRFRAAVDADGNVLSVEEPKAPTSVRSNDGSGRLRDGSARQSAAVDTEVARELSAVSLHRLARRSLRRGRTVLESGVGRVYGDSEDGRQYRSLFVPTGESTFELVVYEHVEGDHVEQPFVETDFVKTVLDELLDIFFVFDMELQFVHWNQRLPEVTGYDDDQIAEMSPLDFVPADQQDVALSGLSTIAESGEGTEEFAIVTSDGDRIPYRWTGSLVEDDRGNPQYICGIGRDVSTIERKKEQLRYERDLIERIFETSPVGVLVLDRDGRITRANSRAAEMFAPATADLIGTSSRDLPVGLPDDLSWADDDPLPPEYDQTEDLITAVLESKIPINGLKVEVRTGEGTSWISANAAPLQINGEIERVIVTLEDVTENLERRRELEAKRAELDELVEELRQSNSELEHFAYVASHDLKEPLRVVANYLQLLDRRYGDQLDADGQEFVNLAVDGAERMRQRVDDLLMYSRVDRHGGSLEPIDCNDVVETALSSLRITIRETDANVQVGDLPAVLGDEDQLVQLFQNLVGNAVDNAGDASPVVRITTESTGDECVIAVADEGVGIPSDRQDRIFDLFYTGPESDSTGIGLAICQKIVDRHDGRIWVESETGEGTTFYVALQAAE